MKKIIVIICCIFLLMGCGANDYTEEEAIDTFFNKYRQKDDNVITQLVDTITNEDMEDASKEEYQKLMEKQYDQFAYVIKDIEKQDDSAIATVEITVLNYRSAILKAEEELNSNPKAFDDEQGNFSEEKYMDYKIEKMKEVTDTTTHTIEVELTKEDDMWKVRQLSGEDISKLHGLY